MKKFVFSVASRAAGRLQIKPSGSGHENDAALEWEFSFPLPQYRHLFLYLFIIFIVWMVKHYDTKTEKPFLGGGGGIFYFHINVNKPLKLYYLDQNLPRSRFWCCHTEE